MIGLIHNGNPLPESFQKSLIVSHSAESLPTLPAAGQMQQTRGLSLQPEAVGKKRIQFRKRKMCHISASSSFLISSTKPRNAARTRFLYS